jgi:hypothetical protein
LIFNVKKLLSDGVDMTPQLMGGKNGCEQNVDLGY